MTHDDDDRPVQSFGPVLRTLRGPRRCSDLARRALTHPGLPPPTVRAVGHVSNYWRRIEQDRVPHVGLQQLQLIARGFGYGVGLGALAQLFADLERVWVAAAQRFADERGEAAPAALPVDPRICLRRDVMTLCTDIRENVAAIAARFDSVDDRPASRVEPDPTGSPAPPRRPRPVRVAPTRTARRPDTERRPPAPPASASEPAARGGPQVPGLVAHAVLGAVIRR